MKKMKLLCILLAIFLVISVPLVLLDQLVFRVQCPEAFVYKGMPAEDLYAKFGAPDRDVGSGLPILEFDLEDGRILRTSLMNSEGDNWYVYGCSIEPGGDPSMNRWILPMILAAVALIEVVVYTIIILTRRKRMQAVE